MSVKLQFQLTQDEYVRAQRVHCKSISPVVTIGAGLIFAVGGILFARTDQPALQICGYGLLLLAAYFVILAPILRARFKKSYRGYKAIQQAYDFDFSESGVKCKSDLSASELNWNLYTGFREGEDMFLLYMSRDTFQVVPKRAIALEDIGTFRELLARKISLKK